MSNGKNTIDYSSMSMQELFRMEAESQASILTQGLLDLEGGKDSRSKLEALMRASHSMKGAARIVGLEGLVTLAHVMEDWFVAAQHGNIHITSEQIDLLLKAVDLINQVSSSSDMELDQYVEDDNPIIHDMVNRIREAIYAHSQDYITAKEPSVEMMTDRDTVQPDDEPGVSKQERRSANRVVRIDATRLNHILGLSSELVVESRWLHPFTKSMMQFKKRQIELSNILEDLRESMLDSGSMTSLENFQFMAAQRILSECRNLLSDKIQALDDFDRRNLNLSSRIYKEVVSSRMRPFVDATQGFQRMVRDLSRDLGKNIKLTIFGTDTPVDRDVLEKVKSPLAHLLRNAIDHGIETEVERIRLGKNKEAQLTLSAHHGAGMLTIIVQDDGAGIDLDKIRANVLQRKLVQEKILNNLSTDELLEFLYLPEFSTRENVTEISGRGVGLDVVHKLVMELHGSIRIETERDKGCKFIVKLPVTLSLMSAIMVSVSGENYAFPVSRVESLHIVSIKEIEYLEGKQYIMFNNENIGLIAASQILQLPKTEEIQESYSVVVIKARDKSYGVVVDKFLGRRELSVQAIDTRLGKIQDISAAAVTDEGETVLIVDIDDMTRSIELIVDQDSEDHLSLSGRKQSLNKIKKILVVDDSLTVREVERKLLMNYGYAVDVAIDGMDGWNAVRRTKYDLIITDVDMPRMDGIELVTLIKKDYHLSKLPIMIVSYKDRYEDRQRGLEVGADYYFAKGSFHDETLLDAVVDLIGEAQE